MSTTQIKASNIETGAVTSIKIADGAVIASKIPTGEITADKLSSTAVTDKLGYTPLQSSDLSTYATQTYVGTQISNLVAAAPSTLDTLNELAAALGNDANYAATITTALGTKVPKTTTLTINGTSYDLSANRTWTIDALPSQSGNNGKFLTTNGTAASWAALPSALSILNRAGSSVTVSVANGVLPVLNRSSVTINVAIS